jgi:hypothetical protein
MKRMIGVLLIVVAMVVTSCGGGEPAPTATTSSPAGGAVSATPTPRPTPTEEPPEPTSPPEDFQFGEATDLSRLSSYRLSYDFRWESTEEGQTETGSWQMIQEVVKQPPAQRTVWSSVEDGEESSYESIQIGPETYINSGDGWIVMVSGSAEEPQMDALFSDPFDVVSGNTGKLVQRNVVVNGLSTDHYQFDESTLGATIGLGVVAKAQGDVWVSTEYDVVVKYSARYEGEDLAATGGSGVLELDFELSDVNQPISIEAPAGVESPIPADIPIMDDATDLFAVEGMVSFATSQSLEEVTTFYDAQLATQGWTKGESGMPGMYTYTKGDRTVTFFLSEDAGKTSVSFTISE